MKQTTTIGTIVLVGVLLMCNVSSTHASRSPTWLHTRRHSRMTSRATSTRIDPNTGRHYVISETTEAVSTPFTTPGTAEGDGTVLFTVKQPISIYASALLARPSASSPLTLIAGAGQNGAPPDGSYAYKVEATSNPQPVWSNPVPTTTPPTLFEYAAVGGPTSATLTTQRPTQTSSICFLEAVDIETGKSKWNTKIEECFPGDGRPIHVSSDGAYVAVVYSTINQAKNISQGVVKVFDINGSKNYTYVVGNDARSISLGTKYLAVIASDGRSPSKPQGANMFVVLTFPELNHVYAEEQLSASVNVLCMNEAGDLIGWGFTQFHVYSIDFNGKVSIIYTSGASTAMYYSTTCVIKGNTTAVGYSRDDLKENVVQVIDNGKEVYQYKYPIDTNSIYQDTLVSSAMLPSTSHFIMGSWGSSNGTSPTVAVFSTKSSTPVFTYTSPGSIFSVDIYQDSTSGDVFASAAGKAVHANKEGYGGDLYAFQIKP